MPDKPRLLAGDNPQIPKGYGNAPVNAYLDAVPGWKQRVCQQLDALIMRAVPDAQKAVKWNTPLYGSGDDHYFTAYHCMKQYVKVTFFNGTELNPVPPEPSKQANIRYFHIRETDKLDDDQLIDWFLQAAALPGAKM